MFLLSQTNPHFHIIKTIYDSSKKVGNVFQKRKHKNTITDIIEDDKKSIKQLIQNSGISKIIDKLIDDLLSEPCSVVNLEKMQQLGNDILTHVYNVTLMSLCIGHKYRFTMEEMKQLGLGAFNYDLGLLAIPEDIINKKEE